MGLDFEVCNVFLDQLAWKWQVIKVQSPKKMYGKDGHEMPTWVCLAAKTVQNIQIMACETSKMHCLQNLFFGLQTFMTHHFLASCPSEELYTSKESPIQ